MQTQDIAALSAQLLVACYKGNNQPLLDHCCDDVMWVGPDGAAIRTRKALAQALAQQHGKLRFFVQDESGKPWFTGNASSCEVLLGFTVDTLWPDGAARRVEQHAHLSWVDCDTCPRIALIHMALAASYANHGDTHPLHWGTPRQESAKAKDDMHKIAAYRLNNNAATVSNTLVERICLRGLGHTTLYLNWDDVVYAESLGRHTLVHTSDGNTLESVETLSSLARRYSSLFVRCHASYLVNPTYVRGITRCRLTLSSGVELPIPEKKYTAVKARLAARIGASNRSAGHRPGLVA